MDALIGFIEGHRADGNPFFAYLSYTPPHDPLHAPAEYIARYAGRYEEGYLLARRLGLQVGVDVARGPEDTAFYTVVGSPW